MKAAYIDGLMPRTLGGVFQLMSGVRMEVVSTRLDIHRQLLIQISVIASIVISGIIRGDLVCHIPSRVLYTRRAALPRGHTRTYHGEVSSYGESFHSGIWCLQPQITKD